MCYTFELYVLKHQDSSASKTLLEKSPMIKAVLYAIFLAVVDTALQSSVLADSWMAYNGYSVGFIAIG